MLQIFFLQMPYITTTHELKKYSDTIKLQTDTMGKFEEASEKCSRRELKINTADHGITHPTKPINIGYCSGSCHGRTDIRHKILLTHLDEVRGKDKTFKPEERCCVPFAYVKQSVMFENSLNPIIIDDLVVKSCHCVPRL